jgi:integrase
VCASSNLAGGATKKAVQSSFPDFTYDEKLTLSLQNPCQSFFVAGTMREKAPGRWELRVFLGRDPTTGKPKQVSRVYTAPRREPGAGRREAAKKLASLIAEVERGGHGASAATFGVLLDEWTAHGERMGGSPKTLHEYRRKIYKRIRPALGAKRLDKLTAHDLDRFYAAQLGGGLGERTVQHLHRIISAALRQGRKWGWVTTNVADDATAPTPRKTELSVPSPVRVSALIREAARPSSRFPGDGGRHHVGRADRHAPR